MQPVLNYRLQHTITERYSEDLGLKYFLVRLLAHNREKIKQKPDDLLKIVYEISLLWEYL